MVQIFDEKYMSEKNEHYSIAKVFTAVTLLKQENKKRRMNSAMPFGYRFFSFPLAVRFLPFNTYLEQTVPSSAKIALNFNLSTLRAYFKVTH